jgi:hypothetical protein
VQHVDIMYPEVTNKAKRHMSRTLNGHLGKGNQKPLPRYFQQGLRDLFPLEDYMGSSLALSKVGCVETVAVAVMMPVHTTRHSTSSNVTSLNLLMQHVPNSPLHR